jgi:hypothetical protein
MTESFAMASKAMSKILGQHGQKKSNPFTADGEIHVPPTALLSGASQSGGDKINPKKDNARDQGAIQGEVPWSIRLLC